MPRLDGSGRSVDVGALHAEVVEVEGGHLSCLSHLLPNVDMAHLLVVCHCKDVHLTHDILKRQKKTRST